MVLAQSRQVPLAVGILERIPFFLPLPRSGLVRDIAEVPSKSGRVAVAPQFNSQLLRLRSFGLEIFAGSGECERIVGDRRDEAVALGVLLEHLESRNESKSLRQRSDEIGSCLFVLAAPVVGREDKTAVRAVALDDGHDHLHPVCPVTAREPPRERTRIAGLHSRLVAVMAAVGAFILGRKLADLTAKENSLCLGVILRNLAVGIFVNLLGLRIVGVHKCAAAGLNKHSKPILRRPFDEIVDILPRPLRNYVVIGEPHLNAGKAMVRNLLKMLIGEKIVAVPGESIAVRKHRGARILANFQERPLAEIHAIFEIIERLRRHFRIGRIYAYAITNHINRKTALALAGKRKNHSTLKTRAFLRRGKTHGSINAHRLQKIFSKILGGIFHQAICRIWDNNLHTVFKLKFVLKRLLGEVAPVETVHRHQALLKGIRCFHIGNGRYCQQSHNKCKYHFYSQI